MKSLFASKTFWFNLIVGAVQVADMLVGTGIIPEPYGVAAQSIVNIILRLVTNQPVAVSTKLTKTAR